MDRHMYSAVAPRLGQAEVMNSFFHNFMNRKLSMVEFYMRCESALAQQRQHEFHASHVNEYEQCELKTKLELEKVMSEYYTQANFKSFQELLSCWTDGETKIVRDELPHTIFQVSESDKAARMREVAIQRTKWPVAHVRGLRVTVSDAVMYLFCCDHAMSMRCPIIIFYKMCHKATRSEDAFLFVAERLQRYESDLNEYLSASLSLGCGMSSVRSAKYADTIAIYLSSKEGLCFV